MRPDFLANIQGLILDMDGVLWRDQAPLLDIPAFFAQSAEIGLSVILATNNSTKTVDQYIEKLAHFGAQVHPEQIVNSSMAAADYLKRLHPQGGPVFIVGESGLVDSLSVEGFYLAEENVLAVVAGLDRQITYSKLNKASRLIRDGAPFIGTNPDRTFPTPTGLTPGSGSVLAFIEAASGVSPTIMGKPERYMFDVALRRLNLPPNAVLAVGDRMDTDIQGGQRAGCRTAVVLSGVSTLAEVQDWRPQPDLILDNLADLLSLMK
jgi:4-nitrophenyl phosphatase